MKVYKLMARLEKLPSGAEVMCSGLKTVDQVKELEPIWKDDRGIDQYQITENIIDVDIEGNHVYIQF